MEAVTLHEFMPQNQMKSHSDTPLRVQSTRSSTGCQTCKNRRIKCDESHPQCKKCVKSNRMCSYSANQSDSWKKFVVYSPRKQLSETPDLSFSEKRALQYFRCHGAQQITAPFQSELWVDCIFQLADSFVFVRSALIAFSTTHESYAQPLEARLRLQRVAERHYNKALNHISSANRSVLSIDAVLVACLIFYSLESLRGAFYRALQHAHSGIKILRDNQSHPSSVLPHTPSLTEALLRDFLALQNQVEELSDSTTSRAYDSVEGFEPDICDQFNTIEDALHHVEIIHNEVYCLGQYCEYLSRHSDNLPDAFQREITPRFEKAIRRFDRWSHGVRQLEASTKLKPTDPTFSGYLILKIYESIGASMMSSFSTCDCFNTFDPGVARGLDLIEEFLDHQSSEANANANANNSGPRTFSVSLGVIPLLFTLCYRCNHVALRDRSLQLLRRSRRREGLWDSALAVEMAERVIVLKDKLAAGRNPRSSTTVQVSEIRFVSEDTVHMTLTYSDPNKAVLTHKSLISPDGGEDECTRVEVIHVDAV